MSTASQRILTCFSASIDALGISRTNSENELNLKGPISSFSDLKHFLLLPAKTYPFKIVSGGQIGVDRFALDWAIERNIPHGGWCPKDRRAEDGMIPLQYTLQETPSRNYKIRTRLNVADSDATMILTPCNELTSGSLLTRKYALNNGKPCLHLCPADRWRDLLKAFIKDHRIKVLNVAGPREAARIEQFVYTVLDEFLAAFTSSSQS